MASSSSQMQSNYPLSAKQANPIRQSHAISVPVEESHASTWDVEVAGVDGEHSLEQTSEGTAWATIVQDVLTSAYLQSLIQALRENSSLPELVTAQLFQHLLKVYKDKVEAVVQEEGIEAIDTSLPHFKVITNRKQGTKRLELVFDNDKIKSYLKSSLFEFFTHAGIWKEFAKVVGTNLVVWGIENLEETLGTQTFRALSDKDISQAISKRLREVDNSFLLERGRFLARFTVRTLQKNH